MAVEVAQCEVGAYLGVMRKDDLPAGRTSPTEENTVDVQVRIRTSLRSRRSRH